MSNSPDDAGVVVAHGLVLRPWEITDAPTMVALFDTEQMDRWTPLPAPFDLAAALDYVAAARRVQDEETWQFAITEDGRTPLGEVLLFPGAVATEVEIAYAVGAPFQGRGLARRAVVAVLELAARRGAATARAVVATDNGASIRVVVACGFARTDQPTAQRRRKGYVLTMATWERSLP